MGVYEECRHYLARSTASGEVVQRCRLTANAENPFACPPDCLFKEDRPVSAAGWTQAPAERMTNTADGLNALPPQKPKRPRRRK